MKNRTIFFIILFLLFINIVGTTQPEWAPVGAKWYYNDQFLVPFQAHGYTLYECVKDSLINDKRVKVVKATNHAYNGNISPRDTIYFYQDSNKIYEGVSDTGRFVFDFSAQIGDTLPLKIQNGSPCDSIISATIDDIQMKDYSGVPLKTWFIKILFIDTVTPMIDSFLVNFSESIGSEWEFPFNPKCALDSYGPGKYDLRCYIDSSIYVKGDYWNYSERNACDTIINTGLIENQIDEMIEVYPSPASNEINIKFKYQADYFIQLTDYLGRVILTRKTSLGKTYMNVSNISPGIYKLMVISDSWGKWSKVVYIE